LALPYAAKFPNWETSCCWAEMNPGFVSSGVPWPWPWGEGVPLVVVADCVEVAVPVAELTLMELVVAVLRDDEVVDVVLDVVDLVEVVVCSWVVVVVVASSPPSVPQTQDIGNVPTPVFAKFSKKP